MWTGCRKYELIYNKPINRDQLMKEYDNESDAYTDTEPDPITFGPRQVKRC